MRPETFEALSVVGNSLWPSPEEARRQTLETWTAVASLGLGPERALDRAALALLSRAQKGIFAAPADPRDLARPFFRLAPEERVALGALHSGLWSYDRLARLLEVSPERLQEIAWQARLMLAPRRVPRGAGGGPSCPPYEPRRPWGQRFLDEEFTPRETTFLQAHLMSCASCRGSLASVREIYYQVERELEELLSQARDEAAPERMRDFGPIRAPMTFGQSMRIFLRRREAQVGLVGLAALLLLRYFV